MFYGTAIKLVQTNSHSSLAISGIYCNHQLEMPASASRDLPKCLEDLLNTLIENNNLRSWQIYGEKYGVTLKIRFGVPENGHQTNDNNVLERQSFSKKAPSRMKRDADRMQIKKVTPSESSSNDKNDEIEIPRGEEGGVQNSHFDTGEGQTGIPTSPVVPDQDLNSSLCNTPPLNLDSTSTVSEDSLCLNAWTNTGIKDKQLTGMCSTSVNSPQVPDDKYSYFETTEPVCEACGIHLGSYSCWRMCSYPGHETGIHVCNTCWHTKGADKGHLKHSDQIEMVHHQDFRAGGKFVKLK